MSDAPIDRPDGFDPSAYREMCRDVIVLVNVGAVPWRVCEECGESLTEPCRSTCARCWPWGRRRG